MMLFCFEHSALSLGKKLKGITQKLASASIKLSITADIARVCYLTEYED